MRGESAFEGRQNARRENERGADKEPKTMRSPNLKNGLLSEKPCQALFSVIFAFFTLSRYKKGKNRNPPFPIGWVA
ncbi:MAG: hypothetical protein EBY15_06720 [Gammaproteobacteria bacterium]|nr:hypothetical protein [Gammaproteobacteria bacterium]